MLIGVLVTIYNVVHLIIEVIFFSGAKMRKMYFVYKTKSFWAYMHISSFLLLNFCVCIYVYKSEIFPYLIWW